MDFSVLISRLKKTQKERQKNRASEKGRGRGKRNEINDKIQMKTFHRWSNLKA